LLRLLNLFLALSFFFWTVPASFSSDDFRDRQLHFRSALLTTNVFGGSISRSYSVANTVDLEYETFNHSKASTVFRGTIAHSLELGRTVYAFMGLGRRFYFGSTGISVKTAGNGFEVDHIPKRRYYYGADLGYSSGVISVLKGTPLQTVTSMIDFGGVVGMLYQLSRSNAIEAQFGMSFGYGFSGVAAAAQTTRMLIGFAHSF
jgi:hypothetical protein